MIVFLKIIMNLMKYICDAISQKVNSSLLAHIAIIEQYYRHQKELIISGADPGIFIRGSNFSKILTSKKRGDRLENGGGRGGVVVVISILQKYGLRRSK